MSIEIIKIRTHLTNEEKETLLHYDYTDKRWIMDSVVMSHYNKALKQGWEPLTKYEYEDGTTAGYVLTAPARAITIRSVEAKKMSEKQLGNLRSDDDE
jgi:hypothetical protein